eukprot:c25369_g1_i3 orf=72-617(+)
MEPNSLTRIAPSEQSAPIESATLSTAELQPAPLALDEQDLKEAVRSLTPQDVGELVAHIKAQLKQFDPSCSTQSPNLFMKTLSECQKQKEVASRFIETLPQNLTKEVSGTCESIFLPLLKKTLGGMGGVHWAGLGLSLISWSLDNMDRTSQNHERCLKLLRQRQGMRYLASSGGMLALLLL